MNIHRLSTDTDVAIPLLNRKNHDAGANSRMITPLGQPVSWKSGIRSLHIGADLDPDRTVKPKCMLNAVGKSAKKVATTKTTLVQPHTRLEPSLPSLRLGRGSREAKPKETRKPLPGVEALKLNQQFVSGVRPQLASECKD